MSCLADIEAAGRRQARLQAERDSIEYEEELERSGSYIYTNIERYNDN
jgi:hypothetical protein